MRRSPAILILTALALAGCGAGHHKPKLQATCSQAAGGHGHLGVCAPKQKLGLLVPHPTVPGASLYPDRSNNNPCFCGAAIKAAGQVGLIAKANQGTGFIDRTAAGMIASARAAGLAVGLYDFDQDYSVAEARVFVARARAMGIEPGTPNTFPLYFDVEFGAFSYNGLLAQIAYVRSQGYRVGIYTGDWYWGPHVTNVIGCRQPAGLSSEWLSGFPNAPVPCAFRVFNAHQFTDTPSDLTVYLGSRAQFEAFVHASIPRPPRLHCFGPHAQRRNPVCVKLRPEASRWSRARDSTLRALRARGCSLQRQPRQHTYRAVIGYLRSIEPRHPCREYGQRAGYFARKVHDALIHH